MSVLICSGCSNRIPHMGCPQGTFVSPQFWRLKGPRRWGWQGWVSSKDPFSWLQAPAILCVFAWPLLCVCVCLGEGHGEKGKERKKREEGLALWGLPHKVTDPIGSYWIRLT